jgi:hypothetical protein
MTRPEAVTLAESQGLQSPRIIPHKGKGGEIAWHLKHGPNEDRKAIVLPVNVSAAALKKAIEDAQAA